MACFHLVLVLGVMAVISMADIFTLSLGDINQYSASLAATPTLTGSRIVFTEPASPNDGVDVIFSDELRTNIAKTMESNCKSVDNQCIESIKSLLSNPKTELEARQVLAAGAGLFALIALAIPWFEKERSQGVPVALHIPSTQLDPAASAAQASTIAAITGTGSPFVTITPQPEAPSVTDPSAPQQTIISSPQDGHSPGDLAIYLPDDLAGRLTEIIQRSQKCAAGDAFHGSKPIGIRDLEGPAGAAICAAEQIVLNASPTGPFAELAQLTSQQLAWSSATLVEAMATVTAFAVSKARFMQLGAEVAVTLSFWAFMLAYKAISDNKPLSRVNWISGNDLKGRVTQSPLLTTMLSTPMPTSQITTTSTSTSSMLECLATCKMIGAIRRCETKCPTITGVPATKTTPLPVKTVSFEPWKVPPRVQVPIQAPIGICPPDNDTEFPIDLFARTYSEFCKEADKTLLDMSWTVNFKGEQISPKSRRFKQRDDPTNTDKYKDFRFSLWWRFQDENADCSQSCSDAFKGLLNSDSCKRGSENKNMAASGGMNVGCGTYSFSIDGKSAGPKPSVTCRSHPLSAPKHDNNAHGATSVDSAIQRWCSDNDGKTITRKPGEEIIYFRWGITELEIPNRSSFWLRASINGSNKDAKFVKNECITALTDAIAQCDPNSDITHGVTASVGTMDYALDLSGVTEEGNPPWAERPSFPAPEFVPGKDLSGAAQTPNCYTPDQYSPRTISTDDINKAIDAFCVDGAEIKGFGKHDENMFQYPPKGQPQFYNSDTYKKHLAMGAETVKNGAKEPYSDMGWCKGYDWKMGRDDCRFALRRLFQKCNTKPDKFIAGDYTYRCVHYKVFDVNERVDG